VRGGSNGRDVSCTSVLGRRDYNSMRRRRHGGVSERERRAKEMLCWTDRLNEGAQMGKGCDRGLPR
jgi:hypothetical protein